MSQWTLVAGIIRIDSLDCEVKNVTVKDFKEKLKNIFGETCNWNSSDKKIKACTVPKGSEGSLQYKINKTGSDGSISWGEISIYGDLRNYEDVEEIFNWVKKCCSHNNLFWIRQCSVQIEVEYIAKYIIFVNEDNIYCKTISEYTYTSGKDRKSGYKLVDSKFKFEGSLN